MRGQVTLEALVVTLALVAAIGVWVTAGAQALDGVRGELANSTVRQAEERVASLCASAQAMGEGNNVFARVFVARDTVVETIILREGWNNVTAEWRGQCLLASTTSSQ